MPRFFVPKEEISREISLRGEDARHVAGALRMRPGDRIVICDGQGTDYICALTEVRRECVRACVEGETASVSEPPVKISLYTALPKGDKLEMVIQKAVELGAFRIVPFLSARCVSRPDEKSLAAKTVRWQKIADEAAKQSGRGILPQVSPTLSFDRAVSAGAQADTPIFLYENEQRQGLRALLGEAPFGELALMSGPEGGFTPEEVLRAEQAGWRCASLGPRIFRCETAPVAALAAAIFHTGGFDPREQG